MNGTTTKTKVAVLDTGINQEWFSWEGHIVHGASFVHSASGNVQRQSPWWLATDPHGSQVANVIAQLDPVCTLYIAKIADRKSIVSENTVIKAS